MHLLKYFFVHLAAGFRPGKGRDAKTKYEPFYFTLYALICFSGLDAHTHKKTAPFSGRAKAYVTSWAHATKVLQRFNFISYLFVHLALSVEYIHVDYTCIVI